MNEIMNYIDTLENTTRQALETHHRGVTELHFTDFPDHANIGDAAISLGILKFWDEHNISVRSVSSFHTARASLFRSKLPVALQGGGNFGGLYPVHSEFRYKMAEALPEDTLLIQESQSVHWATTADRDEFLFRMAPRRQLRIAVRDNESYENVAGQVDSVALIPDSVHVLGRIDAPSPIQSEIRLVRRDKEASGSLGNGVDWPSDPRGLRTSAWLSHRTKEVPALRQLYPQHPDYWRRRAEYRFQAGVKLLSKGETITTDRLHAMLIGLQMGRRVRVIDNSIGKLRKYYDTWLSDTGADVTWL